MTIWRDVGDAFTEALGADRRRDDERWFWQRARIQTQVLSRHMNEVTRLREALGNPRLLP